LPPSGTEGRRGLTLFHFLNRERKDEAHAAFVPVLYPDLPAVSRNRRAAEGQPQPKAPPILRATVKLHETVEHPRALLRRDARPAVLDGDAQLAVVHRRLDDHALLPTGV